eukprot:COSAG02_NODE_2207_length_9517_cov_3.723508_3_plen_158_part_00
MPKGTDRAALALPSPPTPPRTATDQPPPRRRCTPTARLHAVASSCAHLGICIPLLILGNVCVAHPLTQHSQHRVPEPCLSNRPWIHCGFSLAIFPDLRVGSAILHRTIYNTSTVRYISVLQYQYRSTVRYVRVQNCTTVLECSAVRACTAVLSTLGG